MNKHLVLTLFFIFFSVVFATTEIFKEFNAQPESNRVNISWITDKESDIQYFVIKRSNDYQNSYIELNRINPMGPGYQYTYTDENVFFKNGSLVYYKIEAVGASGIVKETTPDGAMVVHPNISGLFKTWGAIKNIFR